jgi:glycerate kinase
LAQDLLAAVRELSAAPMHAAFGARGEGLTVVIAPNALKGSAGASVAAAALADGVRRAAPAAVIREVPVADGGDGLVDVAVATLGAEQQKRRVSGPRGRPIDAVFAWLPEQRTAIVEMALASGLELLAASERDPLSTTTLGTGQLMRHAIDLGAETLIVGLGGSATNDGGIGMAAALGYRFLAADGHELEPVGASLNAIERIDAASRDPRLDQIALQAVCDVDNPLTGPTGAAAVYGPQKGATPAAVVQLDAGLARLANRMAADLGRDPRALSGAGAAGGLGAGLLAFCGAELRPGAEVVLDLVGLDAALAGADLVLTAEGRIDGQTAFGKAPAAVAVRARWRGIPCFAIAGGVGDGLEDLHALGIDAVFSLCRGPIGLDEAKRQVNGLLADAADQAVRGFLAGARYGFRRARPDDPPA